MFADLDLGPTEEVIFEEDGYILTEEPGVDGMSTYIIYDEMGNYVDEFEEMSLTDREKEDIKNSYVYTIFGDIIDSFISGRWKDFGFDDYPSARTYYFDEPAAKSPEEERELIESLCKSDTIVFHMKDPTTVMLDPIYEGRGFDVYQGSSWSGGLSREGIHELIRRHDKIMCLGHGTPHGLIGGTIGSSEVPLLKDKKIFALWCYAATFLKNNNLHGHLCSDMCPSEVSECKWTCDADVSAEWIYNNMLYLSECLRDVVDLSWTNPQEAVKQAKEKYSKSSATTDDEKRVVEFNTNTLQVS